MTDDSVKRRLAVLKKTINEAEDEVEQLGILTLLFPDLSVETNRWGTKKFSSKLATSMVSEFDVGFSCSCCDDSALLAYPYIEIEQIRVYSKPSSIYIGERCNYVEGGQRYNLDCLDKMKEDGFSESFMNKIEALVSSPTPYLPYGDTDEAGEDT